MSDWNYSREEAPAFVVIPEGAHRVRIASAEKVVSSKGNEMLTLKLDVSGYAGYLFDHIVFMPDRPEITNRKLTAVFDSFKDIKDGDFNLDHWKGKVGAAQVKHEEYKGDTQARVHYFIKASEQGNLPAWKEPERKDKSNGGGSSKVDDGFVDAMGSDTQVPFF